MLQPKRTIFLSLMLTCCLTSFVDASHTYCRVMTHDDQPEKRVHFTDFPGPATLNIACLRQKVDFICCMEYYTHIEWYQWNNQTNMWLNFSLLATNSSSRDYDEDGQIASIDSPEYSDAARYKCVGYGHTPNDVISNIVRLEVVDCSNYNHPPQIYPHQDIIEANVGDNVSATCAAFVGQTAEKCGAFCEIGWRVQHTDKVMDFTPVKADNSSYRIYSEQRNNSIYANSLVSILHVRNLSESDYTEFICWISNKYGTSEAVYKLRRKGDSMGAIYLSVACSVVCLFVLVCVSIVSYRQRRAIRLYFKQRSRTEPTAEGLQYDVVLMHCVQSEACNAFCKYLAQQLRDTRQSYKPYIVHDLIDDIGKSSFSAVQDAVQKTRCFVVVVCPSFALDEESRHNLLHLIPLVDIVYILYGGINDVNGIAWSVNSAGIDMSMTNSCHVVWPIEQQWQQMEHNRSVSEFWQRLLLGIPNNRKKLNTSELNNSVPVI